VELEHAVRKGQLLVAALAKRDVKQSSDLWELADLTAEVTHNGKGRPGGNEQKLSISEWAEQIRGTESGYGVSTLRKMCNEARAWLPEKRLDDRTFWQHYEAREWAKGDITKARRWLRERAVDANITREGRSSLDGTGPVYDATLELIDARKSILRVPAKLAGSGILGNEPNYPVFRHELEKLKNAISYLDRYLADEIVVDATELDEAIRGILAAEGS